LLLRFAEVFRWCWWSSRLDLMDCAAALLCVSFGHIFFGMVLGEGFRSIENKKFPTEANKKAKI
jgi:hypothetical protein